MSDDDAEWFAAKRFGIGPGVPISWQGWALTLAYVGLTVGLALTLADRPLQLVAILVPITATFLVIAVRTTKGGWRWHSGEED
jgi:hypothetical protein